MNPIKVIIAGKVNKKKNKKKNKKYLTEMAHPNSGIHTLSCKSWFIDMVHHPTLPRGEV